MARSRRDALQEMCRDFDRAAHDRERIAEKPDMSAIEKRMLRLQANVYRACARRCREEMEKCTNG